jgi:Conjugative transposon protein TcpC
MKATPANLRRAQIRARAPRALFYGLVVILCLAGLRSILGGPAEATPPRVTAPSIDWAATAYAQAFARVYLTWDRDQPVDERAKQLEPFLSATLDPTGGLELGKRADQRVQWTAVAAVDRAGERQTITVQAGTTAGTTYLAVPVGRSKESRLAIVAYPAVVGPPAVDTNLVPGDEPDVDDEALRGVVERALRNYMSASSDDLLADLTDDAVVSLPTQPLELDGVDDITWAADGHRVAAQVAATGAQGTSMLLRYELEVTKADRWFVRSIHVDPTAGGRSHP